MLLNALVDIVGVEGVAGSGGIDPIGALSGKVHGAALPFVAV